MRGPHAGFIRRALRQGTHHGRARQGLDLPRFIRELVTGFWRSKCKLQSLTLSRGHAHDICTVCFSPGSVPSVIRCAVRIPGDPERGLRNLDWGFCARWVDERQQCAGQGNNKGHACTFRKLRRSGHCGSIRYTAFQFPAASYALLRGRWRGDTHCDASRRIHRLV